VLFLPHETADETVEMTKGAMEVLVLGDPLIRHRSARLLMLKHAAC
jgi:delta 1-pyrroline-5-carboxylate dehydrogenase